MSTNTSAFDYIVVGSGFGGAVAALRLTEKGYRVLVLEAGKRYQDHDFAKSNWNLRRFFFLPKLGLRGIMRLDFFRGLMVLSGAGVGGGSLVYANTLIEPTSEALDGETWPRNVGVRSWDEELRSHYITAKRMLGVTLAPAEQASERALQKTASALGFGATFHPVNVGVYFGEPGVTVKDPYFGGEGPDRAGCTQCGGCMVGCRHNAKNTLVKNYLYLAEKRGALVRADAEVVALKPQKNGGYAVVLREPGLFGVKKEYLEAKNVVLAAGVLGTLKLLLRCRDELKTLPSLSRALATSVRTNSESIIGVRVPQATTDFSRGVAIAAGVNPNTHTKIEAVRYPKGSDAMGLLGMPLVEGPTVFARFVEVVKVFVESPVNFYRRMRPKGFATESIILLVMQSLDSKLDFRWTRRWLPPFNRKLAARFGAGGRPPVTLPDGNRFAKKLADETGGVAGGSISDVLGMSFTAHILGGCPMGPDVSTSVIDGEHRVHGHPGLYVVGGAAVPANLGVNPSLTITAMAERAMARIPVKATVRPGRNVA